MMNFLYRVCQNEVRLFNSPPSRRRRATDTSILTHPLVFYVLRHCGRTVVRPYKRGESRESCFFRKKFFECLQVSKIVVPLQRF